MERWVFRLDCGTERRNDQEVYCKPRQQRQRHHTASRIQMRFEGNPVRLYSGVRGGGHFEQFIMDNRFNCVQGRVMSSSAGKQLLLLGSTALAPIAEYLLQEDESSSEQNYKENGELREAWVYLLYRIALKDNVGYRPSYAFDSVGFTAWALWARALG